MCIYEITPNGVFNAEKQVTKNDRAVHLFILHMLRRGGDFMTKQNEKKRPKRKSHLKLGKETFGDMPMEECFRKAFEPYFNPDKAKSTYLSRLE